MTDFIRQPAVDAVHASPTVARPRADPVRGLVIATVAALFMTFVGALGTGGYPLWRALTYWLVVMELGALLGIGISWGVHHWNRLADRPVLEGLLIALLIAIPLSTIVTVSTILLLDQRDVGLAQFLVVAGVVFVISCLMTAINYALTPAKAAHSAPVALPVHPPANTLAAQPVAPDPVAIQPTAFMQRLPLRLRHAQLLAIEAEDHYLRVHTDAGSELILMRLADAVAEIDGKSGARTHRSWWVARDAVIDVRTAGGRSSLILSNQLVVPVSRNNRAQLMRDGWLR